MDIEDAEHSIWTLGVLLITVVGPLLQLVGFFSWLTPFGGMVWAVAVAALPNKDRALEKAAEGQLAEQKVMELETWAIDNLNTHHRNCLESLHILERGISLHAWAADNPPEVVCKLRRELLEVTLRTTKDLHKRHQAFNRAEEVWQTIESVREEVAGKDGKEFWGPLATRTVAVTKQKKEESGEGSGWSCC